MRLALGLFAFLASFPANGEEAFGPPTERQQVLLDLGAVANGVWSLVTPQFDFRVPRSDLDQASTKCFTPSPVSRRLARELRSAAETAGAGMALTENEFRGDLVYHFQGKNLVRIDYLNQNRSTVSSWARSVNSRGQDIYAIEAGGVRFALFFDDFGIAPASSGFMVQGSALFLKCPPLSRIKR